MKKGEKISKEDLEDFPEIKDNVFERIIERRDYVSLPKERLKTVLFVEDKKTKEKKVRLLQQRPISQFQKGGGAKYVWRKNRFSSQSYIINKDDNFPLLFKILRFFSGLLGKEDEEFENIKKGKVSVEEMSTELIHTQESLLESERKIEELSKQLLLKEEEFIDKRGKEFKQNIIKFKQEISEFRILLDNFEKNKSKEQDIQEFLEKHSWFLGLYYKNFKPQKIAGMDRFDFYLKRFDESEEVIELKRADAKFTNSLGKISSELAEAIDQILNYFDTIVNISSSTRLNKQYNISEFYPKGIIVFGYKPNEKEKDIIRKWNDALSNTISIQTYDQILGKATIAIKKLEGTMES